MEGAVASFIVIVFGRSHCSRIHMYELPDMPVQVLEPVSIHKSMVLGLIVGGSAGCDRVTYHLIDFLTALAGQANEHFGALRRVANLLRRKQLELFLRQQHDGNIFRPQSCRSRSRR